MKRTLLIAFVSIQSLLSFSQLIEVQPELNSDDIFIDLTYLKESHNYYQENIGIDFAYRFLITTHEIYAQVYIEKITFGDEGGSKKILWRKKLDMDVFYELGAKGEISDIEFEKWTDNESFKMKIQGIQYEVSNLNSNKWEITRKN